MIAKFLTWLPALLVVGGFSFSSSATAQDVGDSISLTYDDGAGNTLSYRLFLPPGYDDPSKSFPLTVFLHGSGQTGTDNVSQLLFIDGLVEATQSEQFASFLLVPQSQPGLDGWGPNARSLVKQVMDQLEQQYSIDASRRYLTGLSMGGFGTWDFIADDPDLFDAAAPMSAWGNPNDISQYLGTRVWSFHGRADALPAAFNRATVLAIEEAGGAPLYTETGGGHVIWQPIYDDPDGDLYSWMFEGVEPSMGTLYYDPATGSVQIDAGAAPGGAINFLQLNTTSPISFNLPDTVYLDGQAIDADQFFAAANSTFLRFNDIGGPGFGGLLDLGAFLPAGLDYNELHDLFLNKTYRSPSTTGVRYLSLEFAIPEPCSLVIGVIAIAWVSSCSCRDA